jgi:hypothetical protein
MYDTPQPQLLLLLLLLAFQTPSMLCAKPNEVSAEYC